jgi:hypothetical protein
MKTQKKKKKKENSEKSKLFFTIKKIGIELDLVCSETIWDLIE